MDKYETLSTKIKVLKGQITKKEKALHSYVAIWNEKEIESVSFLERDMILSRVKSEFDTLKTMVNTNKGYYEEIIASAFEKEEGQGEKREVLTQRHVHLAEDIGLRVDEIQNNYIGYTEHLIKLGDWHVVSTQVSVADFPTPAPAPSITLGFNPVQVLFSGDVTEDIDPQG